jgi:hypothetical protein
MMPRRDQGDASTDDDDDNEQVGSDWQELQSNDSRKSDSQAFEIFDCMDLVGVH